MSDTEDIDEIPEELWEEIGIDLEWVKKHRADIEEREKESTGVDPAFAQRIRAEMFSERLMMLYGIYLPPLAVMEVLLWSGVKLALDSLGHVQMGRNSLTYTSEEDGTVDLTKYRIKRRIDK